jgi:hypothetical protein
MANRSFNRVQALEKEVKLIYGSAVIGASGALGTVKGDLTMVKEATAGQYTIRLTDKYDRLLFSSSGFVGASASGVASIQILENPATFQSDFKSTNTYTIQCYDFAGNAVNPASGSVLSFVLHVRNSSVTAGND